MDTYVVIQIKDKKEKVQICSLLAAETEADFKVTTDLKAYVAEKFNVEFLEKNDWKNLHHQIVGNEGNQELLLNNLNIVVPTTDNMETSSHQIAINDEQAELNGTFDMDNIATNIPRMVEVKLEQNIIPQSNEDDIPTEDQYYGMITGLFAEDQPRKSSKRPRNDDIKTGTSKRTRLSIDDKETDKNTCQKCGRSDFKRDFERKQHAAEHLDFKRFECTGCDYRTSYKSTIQRHVKAMHTDATVRQIELSTEKWNEMIMECFPSASISKRIISCRMCQQTFGRNNQTNLHHHSLTHIDFMLYKCMECTFETKDERCMAKHDRMFHRKEANTEASKVKLSKDQEKRVKSIAMRCFPDLE